MLHRVSHGGCSFLEGDARRRDHIFPKHLLLQSRRQPLPAAAPMAMVWLPQTSGSAVLHASMFMQLSR
ncbi:unnamed protein product [Urochloa humidicola]